MSDDTATDTLRVEFDTALFRPVAIQKGAYRLGDRCFARIETAGPGRITVELTPKPGVALRGSLEQEFRNDVLDQELREVVAEETLRVRNLLLAQAFSATSLIDPVGETASPAVDPLRIRSSQGTGR